MRIFILLTILLSVNARAATKIEHLNFFPDSLNFVELGFEHTRTLITSPQRALNNSKISDYSNGLGLTYGRKFSDRFFLGAAFVVENALESGVRYAVPVSDKFSSNGPKEPRLFSLIRIREESLNRGLIHLYLDYSNKLKDGEVGRERSNRFSGRNIFRTEIYHGKKEDSWEFQTSLRFEYFSEGKEYNSYSDRTHKLSSYSDFFMSFKAQYTFSERWFFLGGIGFIYRGNRTTDTGQAEDRELQSGTGSEFLAGVKYKFDELNLIKLSGEFESNDYFVKGSISNFDGRFKQYIANLSYIKLF